MLLVACGYETPGPAAMYQAAYFTVISQVARSLLPKDGVNVNTNDFCAFGTSYASVPRSNEPAPTFPSGGLGAPLRIVSV